MSMERWKRNTAGLLAAVNARAEEAHARTVAAIDELEREHATVNFNTVAARARVTKAYLYAHTDLRDRIGRLRKPAASVDRRVAELEAEVRRLRMQLEIHRGGVNR
jgi:hypothetical protein